MYTKDQMFDMAVALINALIFNGSEDVNELYVVLQLLTPEPQDNLDEAMENAARLIVGMGDQIKDIIKED